MILGSTKVNSRSRRGHGIGSSPGGGGRRERSTSSPRLRASKTGSKLWEKELYGWRGDYQDLRGCSTPCPVAEDSPLPGATQPMLYQHCYAGHKGWQLLREEPVGMGACTLSLAPSTRRPVCGSKHTLATLKCLVAAAVSP